MHTLQRPMGLLGGNLYSEDAGIALEQQVFRPRSFPKTNLAGANIALTDNGLTTSFAATGVVTSVTATAPLASSGGTTPNLTITSPLPVANGGTNSGTALNNNRAMVSSGGAVVEAAAATNGQLLIGSTAAAPVIAALTAGSNITITNAAGAITIAATAAAGAMTLISTTKVIVAATSVTFSGLNGNADGLYVITGVLKTGSGGGSLDLQPNGITTNQSGAYVFSDGTTVSTAGLSTLRVAIQAGATPDYSAVYIVFNPDLTNGAVVRTCQAQAVRYGTNPGWLVIQSIWNEGATNVTSLVLAHTAANGIAANSVFSLYKITR